MKYVVRESFVNVLGRLWMPPSAKGATTYPVTADAVRGTDGHITRASVGHWLDSHAGDFSQILDFEASVEDGEDTIDIYWADDSNGADFFASMYGKE